MHWDQPLLTPEATRELRRLLDALERPGDVIPPYFERRISELTGESVPVRVVTSGTSNYNFKEFELAPMERGDEREVGGIENWASLLNASFWHELGHFVFSGEMKHLQLLHDDPAAHTAANALEDIRMEKRLVAIHPEARPWLRLNILLLNRPSDVIDLAANTGWAEVASAWCGRSHAQVISARERHLLESLRPELAGASRVLEPIWEEFASLPDARISGRRAAELIESLADYIR